GLVACLCIGIGSATRRSASSRDNTAAPVFGSAVGGGGADVAGAELMALSGRASMKTTHGRHQHEERKGVAVAPGTVIAPVFGIHAGAAMADQDPKQRTGMGSEATEGIHAADGDRSPDERTALEGKDTRPGESDGADRVGSEPAES